MEGVILINVYLINISIIEMPLSTKSQKDLPLTGKVDPVYVKLSNGDSSVQSVPFWSQTANVVYKVNVDTTSKSVPTGGYNVQFTGGSNEIVLFDVTENDNIDYRYKKHQFNYNTGTSSSYK
jgi:hypothetical protein